MTFSSKDNGWLMLPVRPELLATRWRMSCSGKAGGFEHWADILYPASRCSTAGQRSLDLHLHWLEARWPAGQRSSKHIPNRNEQNNPLRCNLLAADASKSEAQGQPFAPS
jgi:hypothetical protein